MQNKLIYITAADKTRLEELLPLANEFPFGHLSTDLQNLAREIAVAKIVPSVEVPCDVVTMNSKVELSYAESAEKSVCTLVFPKDISMEIDSVSVLSPVGTAILGCAEGFTVELETPAGQCTIKINKIFYQPEASGSFNL